MNSSKTVAEVMAEELRESGVEYVYGLPGGENVQLLDAIRRAGIRYVLVHHESSAVFMADVNARLTGKPGVCMTTLGPGAANAMAGLAHAYLDRAPILIVTPQIPSDHLPDETHQYIDIAAMYSPVTKGSFKITIENARESVRRALAMIREDRPGPVHLQVTNDDAAKPAGENESGRHHLAPIQPAPGDFAITHDVLSRARRPVIVVGLGLEPERPYRELLALAEAARAPVICTPKAKGCIADDHALAGGVIGLTRTDPAYEILDQADAIIAVGLDVVELVKSWNYSVPLIWAAPWENRDPVIKSAAEFVGPMIPVLAELHKAEWGTDAEWGQARVAARRAKLAEQKLPAPSKGRMLPQQVLATLRHEAPRDVIFTTDVGSHKILSCLTWQTYEPNGFFVSNGLSSMGFGLPAAIAACMIHPARPVACVIGDAGLLMTMGELNLLARTKATVIVIVMNDGALDLIRAQQLKAGKPVYGTEFSNPDLMAIGRAFGIQSCRVADQEECRAEIGAALTRKGPTLIEAMIDPVSYPTTPR
jgi:acetolactate synthase I/II/III large subunit